MKITLILLNIFALFLISCKKEIPDPIIVDPLDSISYVNTLNNNINILQITEGDSLTDSLTYALYANLEENATLKIRFTNLSEYPDSSIAKATWFYSNKLNWYVSDYENDQQTFSSTGKGTHSIDLNVFRAPGKAKMEVFENSDEITKTVTFTWF